MVLFLTIFKNILMFDIKTLMSFYEKKKKQEINFKSVGRKIWCIARNICITPYDSNIHLVKNYNDCVFQEKYAQFISSFMF
jgi:hypothetical protein